MISHHNLLVGCSFWFYIENTICYKCDSKYSTINVIGLMLYRHIYYSKCGRRTICIFTYDFTCFPCFPVRNYLMKHEYELRLLRGPWQKLSSDLYHLKKNLHKLPGTVAKLVPSQTSIFKTSHITLFL